MDSQVIIYALYPHHGLVAFPSEMPTYMAAREAMPQSLAFGKQPILGKLLACLSDLELLRPRQGDSSS